MAAWVLIVDTDLHARTTIARVLTRRGCIVVEATSTQEIVGCLQRRDLACVFLAIDRTLCDGIPFLSLVRYCRPRLPVVVMSDCCTPRLGWTAYARGVASCLQKPISAAAVAGLWAEIAPAQGRDDVPQA